MHRPRTPFDPPLDLPIRPSTPLLAGVLAVHGFFLLPAAWFAFGHPWAWPLLLLPVAAAVASWRSLRLETPRAVVRLAWEGGDDWRWQRADGARGHGRIGASSVRLPWLVVVHLRPRHGGRTQALLLTADSVGATGLRRLRARLRLSRTACPDAADRHRPAARDRGDCHARQGGVKNTMWTAAAPIERGRAG